MIWISLIAIIANHIRTNRHVRANRHIRAHGKANTKPSAAKGRVLLMIAATALLTFANTQAQANTLAGDSLRETIGGHTVVMQTMGVSLPVTYRANGTMAGRMQGYVAAMAGESKLSDSGKWWIKGSMLCQRWRNWLDGKTYCFSLKQSGATIHWTSTSGHSGTARISY